VHLHFHIACAAGPLPLSAPVSCAWDEVSSSIRSSMHGLSESVSLRDRVYPSSFVAPFARCLISFTFSTAMQSPIGTISPILFNIICFQAMIHDLLRGRGKPRYRNALS
jgi:hypothetical protein